MIFDNCQIQIIQQTKTKWEIQFLSNLIYSSMKQSLDGALCILFNTSHSSHKIFVHCFLQNVICRRKKRSVFSNFNLFFCSIFLYLSEDTFIINGGHKNLSRRSTRILQECFPRQQNFHREHKYHPLLE